MFDVSMPHTTAPIGSLTGAMLGRSARNTMTSARLPGLNEPVMSASPATRRPVDGGVANDVAGAEQVGDATLARQLEVEQRGVLHGDDGPHLGEDIAGGEPLVADAQARPDAAVDELLHGRWACAAGHVARRGERHGGRRRRDGVEVGVAQAGAVGQRDIGPEQTAPTQLGDLAARRRRRAGVGVDPPSRVAGLGPSGSDLVQIRLDEVGGGDTRAWCQRTGVAPDRDGTKTVRTPESAWAVSAASR